MIKRRSRNKLITLYEFLAILILQLASTKYSQTKTQKLERGY